jgi:endonuclease-3
VAEGSLLGGIGSRRLEDEAELRERARRIGELLAEEYPGEAKSLCALRHSNPFELLVATVLSAQCTDERVNEVTPALFSEYPDPEALAAAPLGRLEEMIRPTGFFRMKARNLQAAARALAEQYGGEVPASLEELTKLPGVGRKTANVVLSVAFGIPGLPVDTHVARVSKRLGLASGKDADSIEAELVKLYPPSEWGALSLRMILHGRKICRARSPRCGSCVLAHLCPSALPQEMESTTRRSRRADRTNTASSS